MQACRTLTDDTRLPEMAHDLAPDRAAAIMMMGWSRFSETQTFGLINGRMHRGPLPQVGRGFR